jgi:hypothetical protein
MQIKLNFSKHKKRVIQQYKLKEETYTVKYDSFLLYYIL